MAVKLSTIVGTLLMTIAGPFLQSASSQQAISSKVYTVCEVLQNLKDLNDTVVAVRGVVIGAGHGSFLSSKCEPHLTTKGFAWPDIIWLTNPRDSKGLFTADPKAHERVRNELKKLHAGPRDEVILTYVGALEAKDLAESVITNRAGQLAPMGFGPGSDAAAQLIVKTVKDPCVIRHKE